MKKILPVIVFIIILLIIVFVVFIVFKIVNLENNKNVNVNTNKINEQGDLNNERMETTAENTENIQTNTQISQTNSNKENLNLGSDNMNNENSKIKINLIVNNKTFSASLENNETTRELTAMFPMTLNMSDLNSNEKYNYLDTRLTTNSSNPRRINAGDIKLYGSNCLVVFYESFNTSYSYTNLGKVDNASAFVSELGRGNATITFELAL